MCVERIRWQRFFGSWQPILLLMFCLDLVMLGCRCEGVSRKQQPMEPHQNVSRPHLNESVTVTNG